MKKEKHRLVITNNFTGERYIVATFEEEGDAHRAVTLFNGSKPEHLEYSYQKR